MSALTYVSYNMLDGPGAHIKGARVRFSSSHCPLFFNIAGVEGNIT
jgi:hypothetical protein